MSAAYQTFLESKIVTAPVSGFHVEQKDLNPALKPHQKDAVQWAIAGGRRALFESFGLGKTAQELEYCHQVVRHEGGQPDQRRLLQRDGSARQPIVSGLKKRIRH